MNKLLPFATLVVMMLMTMLNVSAQEIRFQGKAVVMNDTVADITYSTSVGELAVVHDESGNYALFVGISTDEAGLTKGDFNVISNVVEMPATSVMEAPKSGNNGISYGTAVGMTDGDMKIIVSPVYVSDKPSYIMLLQSRVQPSKDESVTLIPWNLDLYTGLIGIMMRVLQH